MEIALFVLTFILALGSVWQAYQNARLRARIETLYRELDRLEYGPV